VLETENSNNEDEESAREIGQISGTLNPLYNSKRLLAEAGLPDSPRIPKKESG
jgi:hypothetical protein